MCRAVFILIALVLTTCSPGRSSTPRTAEPTVAVSAASASPVPARAERVRSSRRDQSFGGERWGFVVALSHNGRMVVLRRFTGEARPEFGHHGETATPAEMTLHDLEADTDRRLDDLIAMDASGRRLLVLAGRAHVVDSESGAWRELPEGVQEGDDNHCLPPRHAAFSPRGNYLGWITTRGDFAVLQFTSNRTARFRADGRLWRGWPDDDGTAVLAEVGAKATEWPVQRTSCACRWCNRFARSYGMYGWSGNGFDLTRVSVSGKRTKVDAPPGDDGEPTKSLCEATAASSEAGLDRGPWRVTCSTP